MVLALLDGMSLKQFRTYLYVIPKVFGIVMKMVLSFRSSMALM